MKAVKMSRHLYSLAGKECNTGVEVMGSTPGGTKILVIRDLLQLLADTASEVDSCCLYIGVSMLNQSTL